MDIKVGDVVHVKLRVLEVTHNSAKCVEDKSGDEFEPYLFSIVHVEPRPLQVGDKVTWGDGAYDYYIKSIADDYAFLQREDRGCWWAHPISELRRVSAA